MVTRLPRWARVGDDGEHVAEHRRIVELLDALLAGGRQATADRLARVSLTPAEQVRAAASGWMPPEAVADPDAAEQVDNRARLLTAAAAALTANRDYLTLGTPTNAQAVAQVDALTRQINALVRLIVGDLTGTD